MPSVVQLRNCDPAEALELLCRSTQATSDTSWAWWEQVITVVLSQVYCKAATVDARKHFAGLALAIFDEMVRIGVLSSDDYAIRVGNLSVYMHNEPELRLVLDEVVDLDAFVASVLASLTMTVEVAREVCRDWKSLPVSKVRELRRQKNLLSPILEIRDSLHAKDVAVALSRWKEVVDQLP